MDSATFDMNALYQEFLKRAGELTRGDMVGSDMLMSDIVTSPLPDTTFKPLTDAIAKATGLHANKLLKRLENARKAFEKGSERGDSDKTPARTREQLEAACARILAAPDVLRLLHGDLPRLRVAGSGRLVLCGYVVAQSRRRPKPLNMAAAGPSGAGKSFEVDTVLALIMPDAIYLIGDGSEKFFVFDREPLTEKIVYFVEATALERDGNSPLAFAIRTFMSEGVARYRYVDFENKDPDGNPQVVEITRPGPGAVIITSTRDRLHPEIESRIIRQAVDPSEAQTLRILRQIAANAEAAPTDALIAEWRAYDEWLSRFGGREAQLDFADAAVTALERKAKAAGRPVDLRLRRDFNHVITATETIALTNQRHRRQDDKGRVLAEEQDWAWAVTLLDPALATGSLRKQPPSVHIVYAELERWSRAEAKKNAPSPSGLRAAMHIATDTDDDRLWSVAVPTRRMATACGLDQSTVARALKILVESGCIEDKTDAGPFDQVRAYKPVMAPAVTKERVILPTWDEVQEALRKAA
jgi:hypothetical protein